MSGESQFLSIVTQSWTSLVWSEGHEEFAGISECSFGRSVTTAKFLTQSSFKVSKLQRASWKCG